MTRWEAWWKTRWGMLLRVLFGLGGFLVGTGLLWLAAFTATREETQTAWNAESLSLVVTGLVVFGSSVIAAIRPSKRNATIAVAALLAIPVVAQLI